MILNDDTCHLLIFGNKTNDATVFIGNSEIKGSNSEKLIEIPFDKKLSFKKLVEDQHAGYKSMETMALRRIKTWPQIA